AHSNVVDGEHIATKEIISDNDDDFDHKSPSGDASASPEKLRGSLQIEEVREPVSSARESNIQLNTQVAELEVNSNLTLENALNLEQPEDKQELAENDKPQLGKLDHTTNLSRNEDITVDLPIAKESDVSQLTLANSLQQFQLKGKQELAENDQPQLGKLDHTTNPSKNEDITIDLPMPNELDVSQLNLRTSLANSLQHFQLK
ncbi:hypothetical protein Tsubulata_008571, partial [Turnera subulata]